MSWCWDGLWTWALLVCAPGRSVRRPAADTLDVLPGFSLCAGTVWVRFALGCGWLLSALWAAAALCCCWGASCTRGQQDNILCLVSICRYYLHMMPVISCLLVHHRCLRLECSCAQHACNPITDQQCSPGHCWCQPGGCKRLTSPAGLLTPCQASLGIRHIAQGTTTVESPSAHHQQQCGGPT